MIERRRGHIVAISSISGKVTGPLCSVYCATKFGVRGFMSSLFDQLCVDNHDEFIKLTTVYPSFMNTRKVFAELLDSGKESALLLEPEAVADEIVKAIMLNKQDVTLPKRASALQVIKWVIFSKFKYQKLMELKFFVM